MSELDINFLQKATEAGESATPLLYRMVACLLLLEGEEFTARAGELAVMAEKINRLVAFLREVSKETGGE